MKRCKHPTYKHDARVWLRTVTDGYRWFHAYSCDPEVGCLVCDSCGEWLSLGESNESDERVAVEIRAAELANLAHSHADQMESYGWSCWSRGNSDDPCGTVSNDPRWHAGWLGREINEHTETP